ncbi:MAG: hypothetical protein O2780_18680 [Proteobacteria bacterium]|nr:hypothetical protein [Pseudomonadota bacterium]MDA1301674.1 hypothetical protein [Pseudomonadota bacterium]
MGTPAPTKGLASVESLSRHLGTERMEMEQKDMGRISLENVEHMVIVA